VARALAARIAVVACHTNADVASPGVSDALARVLGVEPERVLRPTDAGSRSKLVSFVPPEATAKVLDAVVGAGGGVIGEYSYCSFRVRGTGTFLPSASANPVVGSRGELTEAEEDRLEIVVPTDRVAAAVEALADAHPYEEVAYDVYPLASAGMGLGRVGRIPGEPSLHELAAMCERALGVNVRTVGDPSRKLATVALCGGSGASLIRDAVRSGADCYVTGDVKHHEAQEAEASGMAVIDAGHAGTERPFLPVLAEQLRDEGLGEVLVSAIDTDPFRAR
ncbi:MAG TPA: Nif3-like dinuclear metal center hexameric protein, partial [Actinomycetota bacterium]|nr:Nif3-like dinuclear metal center hexameric protein [Actinomycetota bacterium]